MKSDRMKCSPGDRSHIRAFLRMFESGVEDDYGTPILGPDYRTPGVNKCHLRKLVTDQLWLCADLDTVPEHLRTAEKLAKARQGPLSRRPRYRIPATIGDSMYDQVEVVLKTHPVILNKDAARVADAFVARLYPAGNSRLKPCSLARAATSFYGNRSLGYPRFVSDRSLMRMYFAETVDVHEAGYPLDYALRCPSMIGARSVARGPNSYSKSRFISQWSRLIGVPEKTVFIPLFEHLSRLPTFCAWQGPDRVNQVVTTFMKCAPRAMLSLDFTQFDAHVPFEVIRHVYAIMASWFESESAPLFAFLQNAFCHSGLFCPPPHNYVERRRGVPSGSVLTNLVDSLVNLWVMAYTAAFQGASVLAAMVQGDDGVYVFDRDISYSALSADLFKELGMTIKMEPDKNLVSNMQVMYLQNIHRKDYTGISSPKGYYVGVRPLQRAATNMLGHEHAPARKGQSGEGWMVKYNTYRFLQQVNNAAEHPRFAEMCVWLWSRDGYLKEALAKILADDREVYIANQLLDVGMGERGKLPVSELAKSPVVKTLCSLARKRRIS